MPGAALTPVTARTIRNHCVAQSSGVKGLCRYLTLCDVPIEHAPLQRSLREEDM